MKAIYSLIAAILMAGLLTACGGGGGGGGGSSAPSTENPPAPAPSPSPQAQPREVACNNCKANQLQVLGRAAEGANVGDDVRVTLVLTQEQYDEVQAWLNGRTSETPNVLCREVIYQRATTRSVRVSERRNFALRIVVRFTVSVSHHDSFQHTRRWAVVRNGITLFADGRREHGHHLDAAHFATYRAATLAFAPLTVAYNAARRARDDAEDAKNAAFSRDSQALSQVRQGEDRLARCGVSYTCQGAQLVLDARKAERLITKAELDEADAALAQAENDLDAALAVIVAARDASDHDYFGNLNGHPYPEFRTAPHINRHSRLASTYREGDIVRVLESSELHTAALEESDASEIESQALDAGDYRVLRDETYSGGRDDDDNGLFLAQPIALPNGNEANNCNAAPVARQYYVLEDGDDAWKTDGGFAFNLRGILANAVIQTENFLFAHGDNMRDMHIELRATPMTLGGFGFYADTGFKWENGGETQAHYGKAMAVYPLFADADAVRADDDDAGIEDGFSLDLYASAATGKVRSDYYEDSQLHGFAGGVFARRVFGITDEWHIRLRRPLSARELDPLQFGADLRIGDDNSRWIFGYYRDLETDTDSARGIWRINF